MRGGAVAAVVRPLAAASLQELKRRAITEGLDQIWQTVDDDQIDYLRWAIEGTRAANEMPPTTPVDLIGWEDDNAENEYAEIHWRNPDYMEGWDEYGDIEGYSFSEPGAISRAYAMARQHFLIAKYQYQ